MKNIAKLLSLFFILVAVCSSCEKHVIEYDSYNLPKDAAEFQLHYFVPVVTGAANNITRVEINNKLYANNTTPIVPYNAIPSGGVGLFFTAPSGTTNIKLYKGADEELVFDQDCTLMPGKQNVFVYDFNKPPVVIDNGYPYDKITTDSTGTFAWVKFYNFLFETPGVTTPLKLQYQYQYNIDPGTGPAYTNQKSDWINLGQPVSFGESTGWELVPVIKSADRLVTQGTERIDYRIRVIGANGEDLGPLQVRNSSGNMVDYADWWNATIGRHMHHILAGYRAATPTSSVRQFYAQ
ncbi:MAG: hypothetical protein ACTHOF_13565 [Flavisolibacter sp.]